MNHSDLSDWTYAESPDVPGWAYNAAFGYLLCIGTFGVTANLSVVVAFCRTQTLQTPFNLVLINLILAELLIATFGVPIDGSAAFYHGWKLPRWLCTVTGFVLTAAGMLSIYTLTALSVQRWMAVSLKPDWIDVQGMRATLMLLAAAWASALIVSLPPFAGWGVFMPESAGISCSYSWESPATFSYNLFLIVAGFIVPLTIMLCTTISVCQKMKENASQMHCMTIRRSAEKRENKVTLMVWVMIATFLVCWLPYTLMSIYLICGGTVPVSATLLPVLFCKISICANPVIYAMMNSQFRQAILPPVLTPSRPALPHLKAKHKEEKKMSRWRRRRLQHQSRRLTSLELAPLSIQEEVAKATGAKKREKVKVKRVAKGDAKSKEATPALATPAIDQLCVRALTDDPTSSSPPKSEMAVRTDAEKERRGRQQEEEGPRKSEGAAEPPCQNVSLAGSAGEPEGEKKSQETPSPPASAAGKTTKTAALEGEAATQVTASTEVQVHRENASGGVEDLEGEDDESVGGAAVISANTVGSEASVDEEVGDVRKVDVGVQMGRELADVGTQASCPSLQCKCGGGGESVKQV